MGKRFNPAPGWPSAPEGWVPPPGWQPDPAWPPAPPGWQIVVDDVPPRRWYRRARVAGPVGLLLGLILGANAFGGTQDDTTPAALAAVPAAAPTVTVTEPAEPAPTVTVTEPPEPAPTVTVTAQAPPVTVTETEEAPAAGHSASEGGSSSGSAYYANCSAAKGAGAAPLFRGDPGYRSGLDRDDDGVACE